MAESLWADLDAMRTSAAQLDGVADEVARMVADLKADLAREGEFWGDDDPGKMIAESYVPGADKAMEGMENLVQAVRSMQSQLASAAKTFGQQDLAGAQHINKADPTDVTTDADDTGGYQRPTSIPTPTTSGQSTPQGSTPVSNIHPTTTDRPKTDGSAAQNNAGQSPSAQSPSAQSADPQSNAPAGSDGRNQGTGGNGGTDDSQAPADGSDSADNATPASTTAAPAASPAAANPSATAGARSNPVSAKQSGSAARTAGSTAGTPWSGNSAGTPWSKSPAASSPTSSPSNGAPPRVSPPRPGGRPGADKDAAEKNKKKEKRAAPQRPVPQQAETDTEAMRIAREMAARHNLEIRGFESSGIHADTVREMAAALDAMVGRYTVPLHGIEIADLAGAPSRVENRNTEAESDDPAPWIMLDRAAVANPRMLTGSTVAVPHSTRPTRPDRPMYTTILRALGGALDLAGGFRARTEAQRTLITEYLRVRGAKGDTLARVVSGYKRWRSALSDNCFRNGVFAPAAALAEAFAAVELDGDAASGPAKTLHRLLVTMAKASVFDE
ncbi:hypothetical protein ACQP0C_12875 [Nocardia sp. CA-129566]|uniref:WXG100 family type VII secretion target n=1 Tax=Nocardia sp. CA-129566 TaxID=3239976 RepID=UPI003D9851B1